MALDFTKSLKLASGNIRTPKGRLSFPHLQKPNPKAKVTSGDNAGRFKYTTSLLLPPTADLSMLKAEAEAALLEEFGPEKVKAWAAADKLKTPFLDAFKASITERNPGGDESLKGWTMIRVDSLDRPGVVEANGQPIGDDYSGVYAGRWAFLSLCPSAYPAIDGGKPGVKFYIANVQLLDHDAHLGGGRPQAEDEFEAVEIAGGAASTDSVFGNSVL